MVTITNAIQKDTDKGSFVLFELSGDVEMVQSQSTLKFYATVRKCTVTCTLDLETAKACIGKQIPGSIVRVQSEPYEYTNEGTGEVMLLSHRWGYVPEEVASAPMPVVGSQSIA